MMFGAPGAMRVAMRVAMRIDQRINCRSCERIGALRRQRWTGRHIALEVSVKL